MNKLSTFAVTLDSAIVPYVHFVIMATEVEKLLSQQVNSLCSKKTTGLSERTLPTTSDMCLLHFY